MPQVKDVIKSRTFLKNSIVCFNKVVCDYLCWSSLILGLLSPCIVVKGKLRSHFLCFYLRLLLMRLKAKSTINSQLISKFSLANHLQLSLNASEKFARTQLSFDHQFFNILAKL